jgi:MFS family permease
MLRAAGVPIEQITGLTALVLLPWIFKFLWAPAVDALRTPRWTFRAWIIAAQLMMGATLLPLLWLDPVARFDLWRVLLLLHAVSAATQDVAIDALAINAVPPDHRGRLNGAMQAGMLGGRSVFGGGALLAAGWFGWHWVVMLLVAWIWLTLGAVLIVKTPDPISGAAGGFGPAISEALRRRSTWIGIAFALTSAAAFEATGQLAGPFLIDRGVSPAAIGLFFGIIVVAAMLTGGLLGGVLSDRWGRRRSVALFLAGFVAAILLLAALDAAGAGPAALLTLLAVMYFFVGLFVAASYALFMDLTDPRVGGMQFSTFMAATNGCESWSTLAGGRLAGAAGYPVAFAAMCAASLASLVLLTRLAPRDRISR